MSLLTCTIALLVLLLLYRPALALEVIEKDQFFIYYPKGHERHASQLLSECDPLSSYLAEQGLPVKNPLHNVFGEIISPNLILPYWGIEGIGFLLLEKLKLQLNSGDRIDTGSFYRRESIFARRNGLSLWRTN